MDAPQLSIYAERILGLARKSREAGRRWYQLVAAEMTSHRTPRQERYYGLTIQIDACVQPCPGCAEMLRVLQAITDIWSGTMVPDASVEVAR